MVFDMERGLRSIASAVVPVVAAIALLCGGLPFDASASGTDAEAVPGAAGLITVAFDDQPIEHHVGGFTQTVLRDVRWSFRMLRWMFWRAVDYWGTWMRRAAFPLAVVICAALADGALLAAWRVEGFRPVLTNAMLMLYVYARLFFSSGVNLAPKLLLIGALIYGVVRRDLVPDRTFWPGRIEDVVLIVVATRTFMYACPQALVNEYAERAVMLKRRVGAR